MSTPTSLLQSTHPKFDGPIGNPKAGKAKRYAFRGGAHVTAIQENHDEQEAKGLLGQLNPNTKEKSK